MISYGTDEAGIGWHAHGPTWLGIVTGLKKWFLYPPGEASVARVGHPFASAREWLSSTRPLLHPVDQPLECVQEPADIMYLPAGWSHLTLNSGEVLGAGAQSDTFNAADKANIQRGALGNTGSSSTTTMSTDGTARGGGGGEATALVGWSVLLQQQAARDAAALPASASTEAAALRTTAVDEAIALLERAIEHGHPLHQGSRLRLANLLLRQNQHEQAAVLLLDMEAALRELAIQLEVDGGGGSTSTGRGQTGVTQHEGKQQPQAMVTAKAMWSVAQAMTIPALAPFLSGAPDESSRFSGVGGRRRYLLLLCLLSPCLCVSLSLQYACETVCVVVAACGGSSLLAHREEEMRVWQASHAHTPC